MTRSIGSGAGVVAEQQPDLDVPAALAQASDRRGDVAALPRASMDRCAPPPVASRTTAATSAAGPIHGQPRAELARRRQRGGDTSTATTRAPGDAAIITAESPTPPQPNTATHSRRDPPLVDDRPVGSGEPAAEARGGREVELVREPDEVESRGGVATSSANEPQWVKPGWTWLSQTCWSPARHGAQTPQAHTNGTVTRSPTCHPGRPPAPTPRSSRRAHARARAAGRCPGRGPSSHANRTGRGRSPRPG